MMASLCVCARVVVSCNLWIIYATFFLVLLFYLPHQHFQQKQKQKVFKWMLQFQNTVCNFRSFGNIHTHHLAPFTQSPLPASISKMSKLTEPHNCGTLIFIESSFHYGIEISKVNRLSSKKKEYMRIFLQKIKKKYVAKNFLQPWTFKQKKYRKNNKFDLNIIGSARL